MFHSWTRSVSETNVSERRSEYDINIPSWRRLISASNLWNSSEWEVFASEPIFSPAHWTARSSFLDKFMIAWPARFPLCSSYFCLVCLGGAKEEELRLDGASGSDT